MVHTHPCSSFDPHDPARPCAAIRIALALVLAALGPGLHAQRIKLSAPLEPVVVGQVLGQRVSADGSFLVYMADPLANGRARLVRAALAGPATVVDLGVEIRTDLDGPVPRFELDPTGARVVFLARSEGGELELFSVPSDGSAPAVRLNDALSGGGLDSFQITPDGRRVVYAAEQVEDQVELFAAPIEGGTVVKINSPLPAPGDVLDFQIAPDARLVLYRASSAASGAVDLFVGTVGGRLPARRLGPVHPDGRAVREYAFSASRLEVVYRSDLRVDGRFELYAVSVLGGAPRVLNQTVIGGGVEEFALAPDGKRVVYSARVESFQLGLYAVPVQGGEAPRRLDPGLSGNVRRFRVEARGRRVVFHLRRFPLELSQLLSAPVDGSQPPVRLDLDAEQELTPVENSFQISPDGARVVYSKGPSGDSRLYASPSDGSAAPIRLGEPGPDDFFAGFDTRGLRVVYGLTAYRLDGQGEPDFLGEEGPGDPQDERVEGDVLLYRVVVQGLDYSRADLYRVGIDGSAAPVRVNAPFPLGPVVDDVKWLTPAAEANRGAYVTRGGRLFGVELDRSESAVPISDALVVGAGRSPMVSPDGTWVACTQGQWGALFVAALDGSQAPLRIADFGAPLQVTPDSKRLLYQVTEFSFLESLPLDGSAPAVRLGGPLVSGTVVTTPDSTRVVFWARPGDVDSLFLAPTDGSAPAVDLGLSLSFQTTPVLSPDGRYLVCRGRDRVDPGVEQLFSIDLEGALTPLGLDDLTLSSPSQPVIDPGSQHVIYLVQREGIHSLRKVAITGGSPPVPLLDPYEGFTLPFLALSRDGAHALLPFEPEVIEAPGPTVTFDFDVLAVPVDGSHQSVRLNVTRAGPGTVSPFGPQLFVPLFVGPAGHVLFHEGERLISAALDGSGARAVLAEGLANPVAEVRFTPDGRLAVFALPFGLGSGLYEAATDGSRPPRLLSGMSAPYGRIDGFVVTPDGSLAAFIGDLDETEVHELFASPLGLEERRPGAPGKPVRR